jgi:hypothetical protein
MPPPSRLLAKAINWPSGDQSGSVDREKGNRLVDRLGIFVRAAGERDENQQHAIKSAGRMHGIFHMISGGE